MKYYKLRTALPIVASFAIPMGCSADVEDEALASAASPIYLEDSEPVWSATIPACWVQDPGIVNAAAKRQRVQDWVSDTWGRHTSVNISWSASCPQSGSAMSLRVYARNCAGGGSSNIGTATLSIAQTDQAFIANLNDGNSNNNPGKTEICFNDSLDNIGAVAVHEFGHALGLMHEMLRPEDQGQLWFGVCDGPNQDILCAPGDLNHIPFGPYDMHSVMNYAAIGNGGLTRRDLDGVRDIYGFPGSAIDVALGEDADAPWVVGTSGKVWAWDGDGWSEARAGSHVAIDIDQEGKAWVVENGGGVYFNDNGWQSAGCCARDIGAGANDDVWIIGRSSKKLFKLVSGSWLEQSPYTFDRLDVSPINGKVLAVHTSGAAYEFDGSSYKYLASNALDVSYDRQGRAFILSSTGVVSEFTSTGLETVDIYGGPFTRLSAGNNRQLITRATTANRIRVRNDYTLGGEAQDISVSGSLSNGLWKVGPYGSVSHFEAGEWQDIVAAGGTNSRIDAMSASTAVTVSTNGATQFVTSSGTVVSLGSSPPMRDVGVVLGALYGIGKYDNDLYEYNGGWNLAQTGSFVAVDASSAGAHMVTDSGDVWTPTGPGTWSVSAEAAIDISVGADGTEWLVGDDGRARWRQGDGTFRLSSSVSEGNQQRISGGLLGEVATVDEYGAIRARGFDFSNSGDDVARIQDAALSADGTYWAVGVSGGLLEWVVDGTQAYVQRGGGSYKWVEAMKNNEAVGIKTNSTIEIVSASGVVALSGTAKDAGVSPDTNKIYIVDTSGNILRNQGTGWESAPIYTGSFAALDVGPGEVIWAVDTSGDIWTDDSGSWAKLAGRQARDVTVGADGRVFISGTDGWVYERVGSDWVRKSELNPYSERISAGPSGQLANRGRNSICQVTSGLTH